MKKKLFTLEDLRAAFCAGEDFENYTINLELGDEDDIEEKPDWGDWVKQNYNIDLEKL